MGFFEKFFSKPKQAEKRIKFGEAPAFIRQNVSGQKSALESFNAKKLSEIKHLLRETGSLLEELSLQSVETPNSKLKKIVDTAKLQVSRQLSSIAEKISPPAPNDFSELKNYVFESEKIMRTEIPAFGKSIAYTSIVLKENTKKIGAVLNELQKVFSEMRKEFSSNPAVFLEAEALEKISRIREMELKKSSFDSEMASLKREIESAEKLVVVSSREFDLIRESPEAKALESLENEKTLLLESKKSLEQKIFEKTSVLEKPLKKLLNLAENNRTGLSKQQISFLGDFLKSPVSSLKSDPKADYFKQILKELETQLTLGTIGLKEKELEKKQASLKELLEMNFFESFFWKANEITVKINTVEKEISSCDFSEKLEAKKKELSLQRELLESNGNELKKKQKELENIVEKSTLLLNSLESMLSEISDSKISIVF